MTYFIIIPFMIIVNFLLPIYYLAKKINLFKLLLMNNNNN